MKYLLKIISKLVKLNCDIFVFNDAEISARGVEYRRKDSNNDLNDSKSLVWCVVDKNRSSIKRLI